jgi:hypothetical protein
MIGYILDGEATCKSGIGDDYLLMKKGKVEERKKEEA